MADDRAAIRRAWADGDDARAMLGVLARLHPGRHELVIATLVERLARRAPPGSPMPRHARMLARRLGPEGAHTDGRDPFRFHSLAQLVHGELARITGGVAAGGTYEVTAAELSAAYASELRAFIEDPYTLPAIDRLGA